MRRLVLIIALVVLVPAIEIAVIIAVGSAIGAAWTLLLILATSALGGWLLRHEGTRAWRAFREDLAEGRPPGNAATDGVLVLAGGVMMLVPGFVSDVIGLILIAPPTRHVCRRLLQHQLAGRMSPSVASQFFGPRQVRVRQGDARPGRPDAPPTIEGEIVDR